MPVQLLRPALNEEHVPLSLSMYTSPPCARAETRAQYALATPRGTTIGRAGSGQNASPAITGPGTRLSVSSVKSSQALSQARRVRTAALPAGWRASHGSERLPWRVLEISASISFSIYLLTYPTLPIYIYMYIASLSRYSCLMYAYVYIYICMRCAY